MHTEVASTDVCPMVATALPSANLASFPELSRSLGLGGRGGGPNKRDKNVSGKFLCDSQKEKKETLKYLYTVLLFTYPLGKMISASTQFCGLPARSLQVECRVRRRGRRPAVPAPSLEARRHPEPRKTVPAPD